jgi:hypothetical protein
MNWYAYCKNNPVRFADSSGMYAQPWSAILAPPTSGPDYPGTWTSWRDFFGHYFFGREGVVDLDLVGLGDTFRQRVKPLLDGFEGRVTFAAEQFAKGMLQTPHTSGWTVMRRELPYDLAPGIRGLVKGVLSGDPLVVMGNGSITASVWITAKRCFDTTHGWTDEAEWSAYIEYNVCDPFADPMNLFDVLPWEWELPGGKPYAITCSWTKILSGKVKK